MANYPRDVPFIRSGTAEQGQGMGDAVRGMGARQRLLTAAACSLAGLALMIPGGASASGSGAVTSGPHHLQAKSTIKPGDWIALGYVLNIGGPHPAATVDVESPVARFPVSCTQGGSPITVRVNLPNGQISVPAKDNHWYPTGAAAQAASYESSVQAPDLCNGGAMWLGAGDANGVLYTATLTSNDTTDPVTIQFHAVDANSNGTLGNIDCSSTSQNPNGVSACNTDWSPHVNTTAAAISTAPSSTPNPTPTPTPNPTPNPTTNPTPTPSPGSTGGSTPSPGPSSGGNSVGGSSSVGSGSQQPFGSIVVINGQSSVHGGPSPLGVNLPGGSVQGTSAGARPGAPTAAPVIPSGPAPQLPGVSSGAAQGIVNTVLGPVPVLVTSIGDALSRAGGSLPWNWFLTLALVDGLLIVLIVMRRRRARAGLR